MKVNFIFKILNLSVMYTVYEKEKSDLVLFILNDYKKVIGIYFAN